ncbi:hypothetical protein LDL08_08650 [Nonomuraea glycinis]|uniref:Uncharacterized protein n=1 Tax=Nonomuraea glycinis TaxID=2047744 RepID=A0A918A7D4_9ACTN|nr:hypothetical protein [Nonomuraea glycinis]MCA2176249.1 hypothetical protein [Nonomuraea glycinis]GGP07550.1 hypothetical protein GCM10012278_35770 [Nonomuraea glycinis]
MCAPGQGLPTGLWSAEGANATVKVRKPDGTKLVADTNCGTGCLLEPAVLPVAGTYTVEFRPQNAKTGAITLRLHEVTHLTGTVTLGGVASTLTATAPGQNGSWSFTGTAGQLVSFDLTDANFRQFGGRPGVGEQAGRDGAGGRDLLREELFPGVGGAVVTV